MDTGTKKVQTRETKRVVGDLKELIELLRQNFVRTYEDSKTGVKIEFSDGAFYSRDESDKPPKITPDLTDEELMYYSSRA